MEHNDDPVPSDSLAQSNVDVIVACLNTPPDEHAMECEEEWIGWVEGLGEQPGMYFGMVFIDPELPFIAATHSWAYWSFPSVRAEIEATLGTSPNDSYGKGPDGT